MASGGHEVPPGSAFCPTCGTASDVIRCRCGVACGANDSFCRACGQSLVQTLAAGHVATSSHTKLSLLLSLLPEGTLAPVASTNKVDAKDIQDMVKLFRREPRKKKVEDGNGGN